MSSTSPSRIFIMHVVHFQRGKVHWKAYSSNWAAPPDCPLLNPPGLRLACARCSSLEGFLVRNNIMNMLMRVERKILLRKRVVIETVNDELKNIAHVEHSLHRSFNNFNVNVLSVIAVYCFFSQKPSVDIAFLMTDRWCSS